MQKFRYYYNLAKKTSNPYVRSRLYEVRKTITDVEEIEGMAKIVFDANKFYGTDVE
jgi:hypothetical protein